jgi:abortive infection bacteriophage resistance protein
VLQKLERPATREGSAEPSFLLGVIMAQDFLTYEEQIKKLRDEKGLTINNEAYAIGVLKHISYFALIGGYKNVFINPTMNKYYRDVAFEDVVLLYQFDEELRSLFMKYILKVERKLHSVLSYHFTQTFGERQEEYLDNNNYNYVPINQYEIDKLIRKLNYLANTDTHYEYINYHRTHYSNVPLWVLVNALPLGSVSKIYCFSKFSIQSKVCKDFDNLNERQLEQILSVVTKFRNVCAHGERLFSYRTSDSIGDLLLHQKLDIPKKNSEYMYGKHDLFAVVISLRYLLPKEDFLAFKRQLIKLINGLVRDVEHLKKEDILKEMGFPSNWEKISLFRKIQ